MDTTIIILRVALGLGLGALVRLERQWRARMQVYGPDTDPTRVAAQIVSGIGFLGAGVIMKQGASVTGLNTAATLWATAAVGALAGGGMYWAAVIGAVAIVGANMILRPVGRLMDNQPARAGREESPVDYRFEVTCHEDAEAHVRGLTVQAIPRPEFRLRSVQSRDTSHPARVQVAAELTARRRDDTLLESAVNRMSLEPLVTSVRWSISPAESEVLFDAER